MQTVKTAVDKTTGAFSVVIPLRTGDNKIDFITKGQLHNNLGRAQGPNNRNYQPFTLKGAFETAVMVVTLTWNLDDTDVDLYVTDPLGETSWYTAKTTTSGGELDVDNTVGRGPEHWTLSTADTIQYGSTYKVGVHYYNDREHGPVSGNVNVVLYEGTDRMLNYDLPFTISSDDTANKAPGSTGGDWFYLPPVLVTNGS